VAQSIITNTAVATVGRAINVALGIIVVGLISRLLGADQFGSYATLLAYGAILQIMADLGLYLMLTRVIAQHPGQENYYLANILTLRLVLLAVLFGGGLLLAYLLPSLHGLLGAYSVIAAGLIVQSVSQLFMGVYQKYGVVWRATVGDIAGRLVQLGGIVLVGATHASLVSMAALFAAGSVTAVALHRGLLPKGIVVKLSFSWRTWRRLLGASLPLGALLILNAIYFRIDIVLLSLYQPGSQVGFYGLAYRLIESALFLPAMFGGLLLPRLSAAWQQQDTARLRQYFSQGLLAVLWAAAFVVLSMIVWAGPIIQLIGGAEYQAAAPLLSILAGALAVMFVGNLSGFTLVACHRQKALLILAAALAIANVALNILTIPRWGAFAAAWTTVATETVAAATATLIVYRLTRFTLPPAALVRLGLALSFTAVMYWASPAGWPVLITLAAGFVVYLAASWWLRLLTRRTFSSLLAVL
jgi:O-antigen/teichoic acid export membrane protein